MIKLSSAKNCFVGEVEHPVSLHMGFNEVENDH